MTLSITTLSIMALNILTLSLMKLSIMTFSITTLGIMTLSIMTPSIMTFSTLGLYDFSDLPLFYRGIRAVSYYSMACTGFVQGSLFFPWGFPLFRIQFQIRSFHHFSKHILMTRRDRELAS